MLKINWSFMFSIFLSMLLLLRVMCNTRKVWKWEWKELMFTHKPYHQVAKAIPFPIKAINVKTVWALLDLADDTQWVLPTPPLFLTSWNYSRGRKRRFQKSWNSTLLLKSSPLLSEIGHFGLVLIWGQGWPLKGELGWVWLFKGYTMLERDRVVATLLPFYKVFS